MPFALLLIYAYIYIYMHPQYSTNTCPKSDLEIGNLHSFIDDVPIEPPVTPMPCAIQPLQVLGENLIAFFVAPMSQGAASRSAANMRCEDTQLWKMLKFIGKNTQVQGILYVLNKLNLGVISLAVLVQYYRPRSIWMDVFG